MCAIIRALALLPTKHIIIACAPTMSSEAPATPTRPRQKHCAKTLWRERAVEAHRKQRRVGVGERQDAASVRERRSDVRPVDHRIQIGGSFNRVADTRNSASGSNLHL